jgi:hypothetical protein
MPKLRASLIGAAIVAATTVIAPAHAQPGAMPPDQQVGPMLPDQGAPPQAGPDMPMRPPPQGPPPGAVRATFVSSSPLRWDVTLDQIPACATPCTLWVAPLQYVSMRSQERDSVRLDVGNIPRSDVLVTAEPLSRGAYATGIVFVTFGGMAVVTGITLTAVGCATDRSGMCTAGLITGGAGIAMTAGSIYLMKQALPRARVVPAISGTSAGVAGTF